VCQPREKTPEENPAEPGFLEVTSQDREGNDAKRVTGSAWKIRGSREKTMTAKLKRPEPQKKRLQREPSGGKNTTLAEGPGKNGKECRGGGYKPAE